MLPNRPRLLCLILCGSPGLGVNHPDNGFNKLLKELEMSLALEPCNVDNVLLYKYSAMPRIV
jgi:hypothetical protein